MRCDCCQKFLSDYESTLRSATTNEFMDTCLKCLKDIPVATVGRADLSPFESAEDMEEELDTWEFDEDV